MSLSDKQRKSGIYRQAVVVCQECGMVGACICAPVWVLVCGLGFAVLEAMKGQGWVMRDDADGQNLSFWCPNHAELADVQESVGDVAERWLAKQDASGGSGAEG